MVLTVCTQKVRWVRYKLKDRGHEQVGETEVRDDNQGAIALARNVGYNARTKHIDIRRNFIRENVVNDTTSVKYIKTEDQVAYMLTKALKTKRLKFLCKASGNKIASTSK